MESTVNRTLGWLLAGIVLIAIAVAFLFLGANSDGPAAPIVLDGGGIEAPATSEPATAPAAAPTDNN